MGFISTDAGQCMLCVFLAAFMVSHSYAALGIFFQRNITVQNLLQALHM